VIIDLRRFLVGEQPYWSKLEGMLDQLEADPQRKLGLPEVREFHYLYERASSDLGKLATFASEPELRRYLEHLVARAYREIHETRRSPRSFRPWLWLSQTLPQTFRRHVNAFYLAFAVTALGALLGAGATIGDPDSRAATLPFGHDALSPGERVAHEERVAATDRLAGRKGSFSAFLITHNTRVAILTLALGMTWGIGSLMVLFQNGVGLGAIATDYVLAGQTPFLLGWLLPHGVIEIPAILIAGQAGFVLAGALIGWGRRERLAPRLRAISPDLVTLIGGVALMLVWAGVIEAFFSQYHEPVLPYEFKIGFGLVELVLLVVFLTAAGQRRVLPEPIQSSHE
jgi:uncharacterized membrane protein SpoIIM required for sporulation